MKQSVENLFPYESKENQMSEISPGFFYCFQNSRLGQLSLNVRPLYFMVIRPHCCIDFSCFLLRIE